MVLSTVGQTSMVKAAPDTPLPFLDDFTGGVAPTGFVGFLDAWDGSGSSNTLVLTYPTDNLPTVPAKDGTTYRNRHLRYHSSNVELGRRARLRRRRP